MIVTNFTPKYKKRLEAYLMENMTSQLNLDDEGKLLKRCIKDEGDTDENKKAAFLRCKDKLIQQIRDPEKIEAIEFISKIFMCVGKKEDKRCISNISTNLKYPRTQRAADWISGIVDALTKPKRVDINIGNIPFSGRGTVTTYSIDSIRGNACSYNKRTEPKETDSPCGIGGAIDKAVWKAKEEAREKGTKEAKAYLLSIGYTDKEIQLLKDGIERCKAGKEIRKCLSELTDRIGSKFNHSPDEGKRGLREAFKIYFKEYRATYYTAIDEVNKWKEVSLEGSKHTEAVGIADNKYSLNIDMEPNSVWVVVLSKGAE